MTSVIYHEKDLDGFTSGAIIKMALEEKNADYQLIGYDYGQPFPWDRIKRGSGLFMADVSMPMDEMNDLADRCNGNMTWIDHHKSAILDFDEYISKNDGCRLKSIITELNYELSACELCWKHFYPNRGIPEAIELLGMYDTWRNADTDYWNMNILPFQYGMRLHCTSPETFPLNILTDSGFVRDVMQEGRAILKYQANVDAYAAKGAFEIDFKGYRAICMNGGSASSNAFKTVYDEAKHDLMISFRFNGEQWKFSLRSTKDIDLSKLAKENLNGGGHFSAAGGQVNDINEFFNTYPIVK